MSCLSLHRVRALLNESCSAPCPSPTTSAIKRESEKPTFIFPTTSTINKEPSKTPSPILCLNKPPLKRRLFTQNNEDESVSMKLEDEPGANK